MSRGWQYVRLRPREVELLLLLARRADRAHLKPRYQEVLAPLVAALERTFAKRKEAHAADQEGANPADG